MKILDRIFAGPRFWRWLFCGIYGAAPSPAAAEGTAYALIVAINDYRDPNIADLSYAESDAMAVRAALTHDQYGIVDPAHVQVLLGADATYRNIKLTIERHLVRQAKRPEDMAILYFAGHGTEAAHLTNGAAYYLVPQDAQSDNLLATGIEKGVLQLLWGAIGATNKVFISDACHAGAFENMRVLSTSGLERMEGFITLAAASADQRSWEWPEVEHGIFTYAFIQGLQGAADRRYGNGDGFVSAFELGNFLNDEVEALAAKIGKVQSPVVGLPPHARNMILSNHSDEPIPVVKPLDIQQVSSAQVSVEAPLEITLDFGGRDRQPRVIALFADRADQVDVGAVAATALMGRFVGVSEVFRFIDPLWAAGALDKQAELAFSDRPRDMAAVARAVGADLIVSGRIERASAIGTPERLGADFVSAQAHLSARVVYANSGEVLLTGSSDQTHLDLHESAARTGAVEKAAAALADSLMGPMLERWGELRRQRPNGLLTIDGIQAYAQLKDIEAALSGLDLSLEDLALHSYRDRIAYYTFKTAAKAEAVRIALAEGGLGQYKIVDLQLQGDVLSFGLR